ncbi:galactosylceramide sulfotransferase-like isoform X1 [Asterias amurensis]|uniref:galactosylceramide sulfotransferase-like isoform X1 n=1 Tax=Asterias amurensis TaxID=7602 RepID=UPI003AB6F70B
MFFKKHSIGFRLLLLVTISLCLFVLYNQMSQRLITNQKTHKDEDGNVRFQFNNKNWPKETEECTPQRNIAFLKMHKCGSSTVQNILFRYGDQHNLDFVMPPIDNLFMKGAFFDKDHMIDFSLKKYNILCHHTRFSAAAFAEVLPSDAVYITVLRDPVEMFESGFTYHKLATRVGLPEDGGLEMFLRMPRFYYKQVYHSGAFFKNPMLFDLGLKSIEQFYPKLIKKKISKLEKQFDLVMLTEYFDESLILLRHLLCLEIDDIVYFILNARSESSVKTISPDFAKKIREWNAGDVELYSVFNQTFWRRVEEFGMERMKAEVKELRERNQYFIDQCIDKLIDDDSQVWHPPGIKINSIQLKDGASRKCRQMALSEIPYTEKLRYIQLKKYNITLSGNGLT